MKTISKLILFSVLCFSVHARADFGDDDGGGWFPDLSAAYNSSTDAVANWWNGTPTVQASPSDGTFAADLARSNDQTAYNVNAMRAGMYREPAQNADPNQQLAANFFVSPSADNDDIKPGYSYGTANGQIWEHPGQVAGPGKIILGGTPYDLGVDAFVSIRPEASQ